MSSAAFDAIRFYSPELKVVRTANRLPHRDQTGTTCFYTWRMADSIPAELFERWESKHGAFHHGRGEPAEHGEGARQ